MKKETEKNVPAYLLVPDSQYIILPDDKVARLNKATIRNDRPLYTIVIEGRMYSKLKPETIRAWADGRLPVGVRSEGDDETQN